ncbi:hypothetical protein C8F04DRAFT_1387045 [Mycena alexandri]|uniref:Transmembrane protein n=1 Tax=Mycena alexandri TaxID=1745969 RepID=A0AAD6TN25_9AGAR|nr:hypothetical protein C8F04DRAFT_1387045 [Mycena alexandri]
MLDEKNTRGAQPIETIAPPAEFARYAPIEPPAPPAYHHGLSSSSEVEWQTKLKSLEKKIRKYNWSKNGPSEASVIVDSMRDLGASHSDPKVQAYWNRRADAFERAPDADRKSILLDIGRGLGILIAAPFAIAGAVLIGTGMLLKASGNFLTGGKVSAVDRMSQS